MDGLEGSLPRAAPGAPGPSSSGRMSYVCPGLAPSPPPGSGPLPPERPRVRGPGRDHGARAALRKDGRAPPSFRSGRAYAGQGETLACGSRMSHPFPPAGRRADDRRVRAAAGVRRSVLRGAQPHRGQAHRGALGARVARRGGLWRSRVRRAGGNRGAHQRRAPRRRDPVHALGATHRHAAFDAARGRRAGRRRRVHARRAARGDVDRSRRTGRPHALARAAGRRHRVLRVPASSPRAGARTRDRRRRELDAGAAADRAAGSFAAPHRVA